MFGSHIVLCYVAVILASVLYLSNPFSEVKTKAYEDSEAQLNDTQVLDALVSCLRRVENDGQVKERLHPYLSPLHKRLVLGTIIDRQGGADSRKA
jgi:hypothetical protein